MVFSFTQNRFSADFATEIVLVYREDNSDITEFINDELTVDALKSLLNERVYTDSLSCGFSTDISITMISGSKSILLCPALDGCPVIGIGESDKYFEISGENRQKLDDILSKYGFKFPII